MRLDHVRREWFLARFAWHMQDYPQKAYRRIKADLRREIDAAAADTGMVAALAGLDRPRVLAEGYRAELGRPLPRWVTGAVAATVAVTFLAYQFLSYTFGALDALDAMGGGTFTVAPLGAETTFTAGADGGLSFTTSPSLAATAVVLGVAAVTFALGSRIWRVRR